MRHRSKLNVQTATRFFIDVHVLRSTLMLRFVYVVFHTSWIEFIVMPSSPQQHADVLHKDCVLTVMAAKYHSLTGVII